MTAWRQEHAERLNNKLSTLETAARQIIAVLDEEQARLKDREPPSPDQLHRKAELADKLNEQRLDFDAWRNSLAPLLIDDSLELTLVASGLPGAEQQLTRFRDLRRLLLDIEQKNAVNGQLLHRLHRRNQVLGEVLQQSKGDPLYSRSGQLNDRSGGVLVRA